MKISKVSFRPARRTIVGTCKINSLLTVGLNIDYAREQHATTGGAPAMSEGAAV